MLTKMTRKDELSSNTFLESEIARKKRLLSLFCFIALGIQIASFISTFTQMIFFGKPISIVALIMVGFFLATAVSYLLNKYGYYRQGSHVLIWANTIIVATIYASYGTQMPLLLGFMLPILLSMVLVNIITTIIVAAFSTIFTVALHIALETLHLYTPVLPIDRQAVSTTNLFLAIILIPALVAILVVPARQQAHALSSQNKRLSEALEELENRQQASQLTGQRVLQLSAELRISAQEQAGGSQQQVSTLTQVNSSLTELSSTAAHIAHLAQQVNHSTEEMTVNNQQIEQIARLSVAQSRQGMQAIDQTVRASQEVASLYDELLATLTELNSKSASTRRILELLSSIAGETHLLALNASIEAAGAGEYGTRFSVVAQEVKSLATRSNQASQEVVAVVQEIESAISEAVNSAQAGYQKAQDMAQVAEEAGSVIKEMRQVSEQAQDQATAISHKAQEVKTLSNTIKLATTQQRSASEQVLDALSGLSVLAQQNAEGSNRVSSTAVNLEEMSHNLKVSLLVS